jgi:hypothetical protein
MHVDWPGLLLCLRRILRWSRSTSDADLSDYIVSSSARDLLEKIRPDLEAAGIHLPRGTRSATALDDLASIINDFTKLLDGLAKVKPGQLAPAAH